MIELFDAIKDDHRKEAAETNRGKKATTIAASTTKSIANRSGVRFARQICMIVPSIKLCPPIELAILKFANYVVTARGIKHYGESSDYGMHCEIVCYINPFSCLSNDSIFSWKILCCEIVS
jgi:hypothetical protein